MHGSYPFFELQRLDEIALGEQLLNKTIVSSNDEFEDWRTIPKYDLVFHNSTNSNKNESYSANENNEYLEPIDYESPLNFGVGYTSVDEQIERHDLEMSNLPKMPDQNETAYESSKKKE